MELSRPDKISSSDTSIIYLGILLVVGVAFRLFFWNATNLTLEDAFITFRYAENIADGDGFVYNKGERVIGTTSPSWTLILAAMRAGGLTDLIVVSKIVGILFDSFTLLFLFSFVRSAASTFAASVTATLFAVSPDIIPITISGMETPLLLCCMAAALYGYVKRNPLLPIGLAMVVLTRIDGLIFALCVLAASFVSDRRWGLRSALLVVLILMPWFAFALLYTGQILPQSLVAKMSAYRLDLFTSSAPFLAAFTPFLESHPVKIILKTLLVAGVVIGSHRIIHQHQLLIPAVVFFFVYASVFMASRSMIFAWYLIPAVFVSYIMLGVCCDRLRGLFGEQAWAHKYSRAVTMLVLAIVPVFVLFGRADRNRQLQMFEDEFRKEIGLWLNANLAKGSTVFLEPIGYIGYFAGRGVRIRDEIGIVTPEIVAMRKSGPGWYTRAVNTLQPEYILQYQFSLVHNRMEGTNEVLFANDDDASWFFENYETVKTFHAAQPFPLIDDKEKSYLVLQRKSPTFD